MDALSSQATVSGYRAVVIAATELGRFFPMLMTGEESKLQLDFEDEVIRGACITRGGEIVHEGAKRTAEG